MQNSYSRCTYLVAELICLRIYQIIPSISPILRGGLNPQYFFQYLESREPILSSMPLRASEFWGFLVPKRRIPWKNRAARAPKTTNGHRTSRSGAWLLEKWRPRQNDALNTWLCEPQHDQESRILPTLREQLTKNQDQYLERCESSFLQILSRVQQAIWYRSYAKKLS